MTEPFMEHPTGDFETAVDALADAITRLRALPQWTDWITFCAQGVGDTMDDYQTAELSMRQDEIRLDSALDPESITRAAEVPADNLQRSGSNYSLATASPENAARIIDTIFRQHLGIRPYPDEDDDYAVGAEWS